MRDSVLKTLESICDKTECIGAGLVDTNGLLIHSSGAHAAKTPSELAVFLSHSKPSDLEQFLGKPVTEQILLSEDYTLFVRWFAEGTFLLYGMTKAGVRSSAVRHALRLAEETIEPALVQDKLFTPLRKRLEQPRKLTSSSLVK